MVLRVPFETKARDVKKKLTKLYLQFREEHPDVVPELSCTCNVILQGKGPDGKNTFSIYYGGDFASENPQDRNLMDTITLNNVTDINLIDLENMTERNISVILDRNFEESSVFVHSIVNLVFIMRGFRINSRSARTRGFQVALLL